MSEVKVEDPKIQDVLSKLKFLSKIDKHEKLDVASLSLVADTWYINLYRRIKEFCADRNIYWKTSESRKVSLEFIKTTANEALKLAGDLLSRENRSGTLNISLGQMIITTLNGLDPGIQGLKKTYAEDRMFISQVETFEQLLRVKILELGRMIPISSSSSMPPVIEEPKHPLEKNCEAKPLETGSQQHNPFRDEDIPEYDHATSEETHVADDS